MAERACKNCHFWARIGLAIEPEDEGRDYGNCRRLPPAQSIGPEFETWEDYWCGEFKEKEPA